MNKIKLNHYKNKLYKILMKIDAFGILERRAANRSKIDIPLMQKILESSDKLLIDWPENVVKPVVGLVQEIMNMNAYWPKYERFLKNNSIPYIFIDIYKSDFYEAVEKVDILVWRTLSDPSSQIEAKSKIEFLDRVLGKKCLPSPDELWFYEDKIRQQWLFDYYKLPAIKTFISFSKQETLDYIKNVKYPFISKEAVSSGSQGVIKVNNYQEAQKLCKQIFGAGRETINTYLKQKDYAYFQELVPNMGYDLRIIIIGNSLLGYYRYTVGDDFRASGSGKLEKKEIPNEALLLAIKAKNALPPSRVLAVDLLQDNRDNSFRIIETSIFIAVETCEQLMVNGVPGRYIYENDTIRFEEGRFWIQELALKELMNEWIAENK